MFVGLSAVIKIVQNNLYTPSKSKKKIKKKSPVIMFRKIHDGACIDKSNGFKINNSSLYVQCHYIAILKMLGLYLYTLIIGHKSRNILSILN